jgi:hypothetical protein
MVKQIVSLFCQRVRDDKQNRRSQSTEADTKENH